MNKKCIRYTALLFCVTAALCFSVPVFAADTGWESWAVSTEVGVVQVQLIRINLQSEGLSIRSLTDVSGERLNVAGPTRSLQSYVDQVSGFAGINGCYFCPADYGSCAGQAGSYYWMWYNSPSGTFANALQNQFNQGPVIAFDTDNNFHYYQIAENWQGKSVFEAQNNTGLQAVISNGPGLVFGGELVVSADQLDDKQRTVKSNRSGVGFKNDNIYLAVASGATVLDLGHAMHALGMEYAMNLDGGGSSALYFGGQYGVGPGRNTPNALVFSETASEIRSAAPGVSFFAYDRNLRGGFQVSSGNVLGDNKDEIIVGSGDGMGPQVRIFNGNGGLVSQFFAFDDSLRNGVTTTACDVNGDGYDEIVAAQGSGGWPLVKVFDGYGTSINDGFYVLDGKFSGGINLSCGDVDGDSIFEIVVSARRGGGAHVMVYNLEGKAYANFFAYDPATFRGGINVTTIDMDGDGRDEIVTGPQYGAPHVQIFQIRPNEIKRLSPGFYAFNTDYRGGVDIDGADIDGDGIKELLVSVGDDATPLVRIFNIREELQQEFFAYNTNYLGGVHIAGGDVDADGTDEVIVIPRSNGGPQVRIIEAGDL